MHGPLILVKCGKPKLTDTGIGMGQEVMAKAFNPFFTTKSVGQGTGLGLSQVHGFAKQSNGHVKLYSEPGIGTTVKLYLPRSRVTLETAQVAAARLSPDLAGQKVLVVEDEAGVRSFALSCVARARVAKPSAPMELRWRAAYSPSTLTSRSY